MSAADKLAQVLHRHRLAGMAGGFGDQPDAKTHACRCDRRWVTAAEYAAHQAAVVLEALAAQVEQGHPADRYTPSWTYEGARWLRAKAKEARA